MSRIYTARHVLPLVGPAVEKGAVLVNGGRILAVGPADELLRSAAGAERVDFGDAVLLPPLVNAHTHLELTDFPTWAEDADEPQPQTGEDFVDWVMRLIRVKRGRPAEDFIPSIQHGLQLCLEAGTGAVGEILSFHSGIPAYRDSALFGTVFFETLGRNPQLTLPLLSQLSKKLDHQPSRYLSLAVSPHSPMTLSAEYLQRVFDFSAKRPCLASIHLAESPEETELLRDAAGAFVDKFFPFVGWNDLVPAATGLTPLAYLEEQGGLRADVLLVHGVQVGTEDIPRLQAAGSGIVLCPRSNEKLQVGRAPVELYRQAGVPLALGTDSLASNDSLSLWDELAAARRIYADSLTPEELLQVATLNGARLLGLDAQMGSLAAGKGVNFQVAEIPPGATTDTLAEALVSEGHRRPVRQLYLHGEPQL